MHRRYFSFSMSIIYRRFIMFNLRSGLQSSFVPSYFRHRYHIALTSHCIYVLPSRHLLYPRDLFIFPGTVLFNDSTHIHSMIIVFVHGLSMFGIPTSYRYTFPVPIPQIPSSSSLFARIPTILPNSRALSTLLLL